MLYTCLHVLLYVYAVHVHVRLEANFRFLTWSISTLFFDPVTLPEPGVHQFI